MSSSEISFYVDTILVEAVLGDHSLQKTAQGGGVITDLLSRVKNYVKSEIGSETNPQNKLHTVINFLAPGVISMGFRAIGLGWVGILFGVVASTLKIDIAGWISSIWNSLRGPLESGQKVTPEQVDAAVESGMQSSAPEASSNEADDMPVVLSFEEYLKEARLLRLAMEEYERQNLRLTITKEAQSWQSLMRNRRGTTSIISKIIGWIFKVALASAGFMFAGKALRRWLDIDESPQSGKENPSAPPSAQTAQQTKFKFKGDSPLPSEITIEATSDAIESLLIQYAKDTYNGLDGKEDIIRNSPAFQAVLNNITWFNFHGAARGGSRVYLPPNFTSKRKLVDFFIDDVAQRVR